MSKEAIRRNPATADPYITIQSGTTNLIRQPEKHVRLRKTNQIIIEHNKKAVLEQLKAKLFPGESSESILRQMPDSDTTLKI